MFCLAKIFAFNPLIVHMQQCSSHSPIRQTIPVSQIFMATAPRPILKRTTSSSSSEKHVVHFPPAPALTRTFIAHSAAAYDRSPIVVVPNTCALPERGGRTYILDESPNPSSSRKKSSSRHPRAINHSAPPHMPVMPSLVPDLSSESDESDNFPSPHLESQEFCFGAINPHGFKSDDVLAFLPYAPSLSYHSSNAEETLSQKPRRRSERRNEASRDNDRIRSSHTVVDEEHNCSLRKSSKPRSSRIQSSNTSLFDPSSSISDSFSNFTLRDDGCLGGF